MDSHYFQVMKAREGVKDQGTRAYFAYSTILDRAAFEEWRQQHSYDFFNLPQGAVAEGLNLDLVFDFPSRWWGGRVAGLIDSPSHSIFGVLFEIPAKDWPVIQHKEGFITGMCVERTVRVRINGTEVEATAFTTNPQRASQDGPVSASFIEALVRGAESAGLPQEYIQHLKA